MSLRFASPLTLQSKGLGGQEAAGLCKRPSATPCTASASSAALQRVGFAQESTVCLFPLLWVLSKFAVLPKRDKSSWGVGGAGRAFQTGMRSGRFELGILESCSVRAKRALRRMRPKAFQTGFSGPRSQGSVGRGPTSPSACLLGTLSLHISFESGASCCQ